MDFSVEEEAEMWRFAMEDHEGYGRCNAWELFRERTDSERTSQWFYSRFHNRLLPNLPNTKFHVETKLKLCQKFKFGVSDEFLEELLSYADVQLDRVDERFSKRLIKNGEVRRNQDRIVIWYKLKPNCPENKDIEMSDEEFLKLTIVPHRKHFPAEEDAKIWEYIIQNYKAFRPGSYNFWKRLVQKLESNRKFSTFRTRFLVHLAPNMHLHDCDIEVKLELYKKCQVVVNVDYLETLKEHAELELNDAGCITGYKLKAGRAEKRKMSEETDDNQKKARVDELGHDNNVILDDVALRNDVPNPNIVQISLLNIEPNNTDNQLANDNPASTTEDCELDDTLDSGLALEVGNFEEVGFENDEDQFTVHGDVEEQVVEQGDVEKISFENVNIDKVDESRNSELPDENQQKPTMNPEQEVAEKNNLRTLDESQQTDENQEKPTVNPEVEPVPKSAPDQVSDETLANSNADVRISNKMILEFMQKMENSPKELEAVFKREMVEMYKGMASMKDEMKESRRSEASEMKKRMCEMKRDLEASFEKKISEMSKTIDSMKEDIQSLRCLIQTDDVTGSEKKKGLLNLQKFISSLNAPRLEAIEHRIETMIQNPSESNEKPIVPTESLKNLLGALLTLIGH